MEPEDLLQTTYNNLKRAIEIYNESHRAMRRELDGDYSRVSGGMSFDRATRNYEKREKEFNQQVSNRIRESGNIPGLAEEMLLHQRGNGFHARGLAKILNNKQTGET